MREGCGGVLGRGRERECSEACSLREDSETAGDWEMWGAGGGRDTKEAPKGNFSNQNTFMEF